MKTYYVGIDLGTTNSAICSYDGKEIRIWKSPEQNDVTPSAIFIDKRGNKYYGQKAYNQAPYFPENAATNFKRLIGTSAKIDIKSTNVSMTPEECSAEILKALYGYLPEEIRKDPKTVTVITVPAAFNQMKKDATLQAAQLAGIGKVALMQEPVAAIMSVMKHAKDEGIFLIYDLGGGTFDVSIAENIKGKVNLLTHGGKEMCGGRDLDRTIFNQIVVPWLRENFNLPADFLIAQKYKALCRLSVWAIERTKIELSSKDESTISLNENETRCADEDGKEIYLDISVTRKQLDAIISDLVNETIDVTREVLKKGGLTSDEIEKIVFVGGPTNYKPLRDKVVSELAIKNTDIDINPMTAVAEGACIFAESIDWTNANHNRKESVGEVKTDYDISFKYMQRTAESQSKIAVMGNIAGLTLEITSLDSGWSSGRTVLAAGKMFEVPLRNNGENKFEIKIFDSQGNPIDLKENAITITRTLATIGAIPASQSIGVEVKNKLGGTTILDYLIKEGDALPKKGTKLFKAGQTLKAGSAHSINIKLWEGAIQNPVTDNRFIGVIKISGKDFDVGIIPAGAEIECTYEMSDSGAIHMELSIPCIGALFVNKNFYSRTEGQIDLNNINKIIDEGQKLIERIEDIADKFDNPDLDAARQKAECAALLNSETDEPEDIQKASNELLEAKKLLSVIRQKNLKEIRGIDFSYCYSFFTDHVKKYATPTEIEIFENLSKTAKRSIERNDSDFENILSDMKGKNFSILWRQDWFIIDYFNRMILNKNNFSDKIQFESLKNAGLEFLKNDNIKELRTIVGSLFEIEIRESSAEDMLGEANIIRG
jgi:molecular chaperone DnaK